jgi:hypothetical protein
VTPSDLAQLLVDHVRDEGVVDLDLLCREPKTALESDASVTVHEVDVAQLPPGCSIAATYDRSVVPARISVSNDRGLAGQRFSLLHEYAHHLRDQVPTVLSALFASGRRAANLEESVCDAFASQCLIPASARAEAFADGVTAGRVAALIAGSSASDWAVAVAAAQTLTLAGYVLLLDRDAQVVFAARSLDAIAVRRGTPQSGLLERAARGVPCRGMERIALGAGSLTSELSVDAVPVESGAVVVAVDGPVSGGLYSARSAWSVVEDLVCDSCSCEYPALGAGCPACGVVRCPECRRCGCEGVPVAGEQLCERCFILKPPAEFSSEKMVCSECLS